MTFRTWPTAADRQSAIEPRAGSFPAARILTAIPSRAPLPTQALPVLDERQQRNAARAIERLARKLTASPESRAWAEDDVRYFLCERVRAMTRQNRPNEARARLEEVFGKDRARWI